MTENNIQMIIQRLDSIDNKFNSLDCSINKRIDSLDTTINNRIDSLEVFFNERIDSLEDKMDDQFVVLEAKFINRLEKEIGNLAGATAKGFAEQELKFERLENKMNQGFALVDHKVSSLQEFYSSKGTFRFA